MNKLFLLFSEYFINTLTFKGLVISKPTCILPLSVYLTAFLALTVFQQSLVLLLGVFLLDFLTGLYASYIESKREANLVKGTISIKVKIGIFSDTIKSEKLRKSAVKAIVYLLLVILSYIVEKIASLKPFSFESISTESYTFSTLAAGFCVAIEVWSIFIENLPRAGFDIVKTFTKAFAKAKEIKKDITED